jgi:hypothetical protein
MIPTRSDGPSKALYRYVINSCRSEQSGRVGILSHAGVLGGFCVEAVDGLAGPIVSGRSSATEAT